MWHLPQNHVTVPVVLECPLLMECWEGTAAPALAECEITQLLGLLGDRNPKLNTSVAPNTVSCVGKFSSDGLPTELFTASRHSS